MFFLDAYVDLGLPVRRGETRDRITAAEIVRLQRQLAIAQVIMTFPRRLGPEASAEELAADKLAAKRVAHALSKSLAAWGGEPIEPKPAHRSEAAVLDWTSWGREHAQALQARRRYVATWCHKAGDLNGDVRWCKTALVRLNNELSWIEHALR